MSTNYFQSGKMNNEIIMAEAISINDLPEETFMNILLYLDGSTLGICRRVCMKWKEYIDYTDCIWREMCMSEFKHASKVAKKKASTDCRWYHIYRNMKLWSKLMSFPTNLREFYKFSLHDTEHILNVDCGILPLRDANGVVLYDLSTLKYIPVALPEKDCLKIGSDDLVTVIQLKKGLLLQRSISPPLYSRSKFFLADGFALEKNILYFHKSKHVYKVDIDDDDLSPQLIVHCECDIKEITYDNGLVHLFTLCGKIITVYKDYSTSVKAINCPIEWLKQIKHIRAVDNKNYVCYSRNLFIIETDRYEHLYLEFVRITALFFYVDNVLIGTGSGEILLYRLSNQNAATKPIFETVASLPRGKFATQLEVCEREKGPIIIASTFTELYVMEFDFYPNEQEVTRKFTQNNLLLYRRLSKLKELLSVNN